MTMVSGRYKMKLAPNALGASSFRFVSLLSYSYFLDSKDKRTNVAIKPTKPLEPSLPITPKTLESTLHPNGPTPKTISTRIAIDAKPSKTSKSPETVDLIISNTFSIYFPPAMLIDS